VAPREHVREREAFLPEGPFDRGGVVGNDRLDVMDLEALFLKERCGLR
jgi:hypothetical protein